MTIPELIAHLRELEAKATPGPWVDDQEDFYVCGPSGQPITHWECATADAALIVAMRNALPRILERVEKLERVAEAARAEMQANDWALIRLEDALAALEEK